MKRIVLASFFLSMLGTWQSVMAEEWAGYDDRWYVGLMGGAARLDSDRLTDGTAPYYGAYLGRFFSPNFSLDFQIDAYPDDFDAKEFLGQPQTFPARDDFDIYGYGVTGRWHFGAHDHRTRPYLLAGLGIAEHDSAFDDGRDFYASLGGGVQSKLGDYMRLRFQVEGRYDNDRDTFDRSNGFIDLIASVGVGLSFGQPPRPPQPRQAPAPEPVRPAVQPAPAPPPPAPAPQPVVEFEFDSAVLFAFDSADLLPDARAELDRAAAVLAPRDDLVRIEVEGHTDSSGPEDYNQRLSERRAGAVADYLASKGVDRERMRVTGFGESQPKVSNDTRENRQKNRRVVISAYNRR
ncbi:MAG: OmpA family protein [Wenzhouxiangellaceae bacterium]|nr:OmpA family protein [Wenzhouxiangellaceae bacterium]